MIVARSAAWAAVALTGIGLLFAAQEGDIYLAASALSALFVAALFWTLAEIGDRLRLSVSSAAEDDHPAKVTVAMDDFTQTDENGPSFFDVSRVAELERKLAAARAK